MKTKILTFILISNLTVTYSQNIISIQDIGCCDKKFPSIILFDSFQALECLAYLDSNYEKFGKKKIRRFGVDTFFMPRSENLLNVIMDDKIVKLNNDSIFQDYGTIRVRVFRCNEQLAFRNIDIKDSLYLLELIHQGTTNIRLMKRVEEWMKYIKETKQR